MGSVLLLIALMACATTIASASSPSAPSMTWRPDPDSFDGRTCNAQAAGCPWQDHDRTYSVQYIVIHATAGDSAGGAINEFVTRSDKSAHYIVANGRDPAYSEGQIIQMVKDEDTAWALGIWPANSVGSTKGPVHHFNSINIEVVGRPDQAGWCTDKMYQSIATLVRYLAQKHGIPLDRSHVLGHDECGRLSTPVFVKADPCGSRPGTCTFDWDRIVPIGGARTATVLVMDISGSMGESWQGGRKIDSAREAALQFIEHVRQENLTQGTEHWIGVVSFSNSAKIEIPITNNYASLRTTILRLSPSSATNLGAGLATGLQELGTLSGQVQSYVTILSDGNSNTGLSKSQILSGLVANARNAHICINTVAFGNKGDIDEDFLRKVASQSGCGRYEYAASGFDLFAAYIKIRHHALGQVISGLSSFGSRVSPILGRTIPLGTISIPSGQRELQITLGWSEVGRLQLKLYDPAGRQVTTSYPGAQIYTAGQFAHAIVTSPMQGFWRVDALPSTSMPGGTQYFAIGSTRPGGIAFALPLPVFTIGDRTISLPGNMPTWALVLVSVACLAIGIWQMLVDAGLL